MDYLIKALQNLTAKESYLLRNKIRKQEKKTKLLKAVQDQKLFSNKELSKAISYGDNLTNLYTLKSRLLEDIISVKLELNRNEKLEAKEMVQNLRLFLYSKDYSILLRQLKVLKKKCIEFEFYNELREICFCYMLLNKHDHKKLSYYRSLLRESAYKQKLVDEIEEIFYLEILDGENLFFYYHNSEYYKLEKKVKEIDKIYNSLESKGALFLKLSSEVILCLNSSPTPSDLFSIQAKMQALSEVYSDSVVSYRYPNCEVAIECLFSKYYYLSGNEIEFRKKQANIAESVKTIRGYKMFDSTFLYYIYTEILFLVKNTDYKGVVRFIENSIPEKFEPSDLTTIPAFQYLRALSEFYKGNHLKSSSVLIRSRVYFSYLDNLSSWIAIENILLNIINSIIYNDFSTISAELSYLSRILKKYDHEKKLMLVIRNFVKKVNQAKRNGDLVVKDVNQDINVIRKEWSVFRLVKMDI